MSNTTRSPYDFIHPNKILKITPVGHGTSTPQTVVFTGYTTLTTGDVILRTKTVDEYGWWHTGVNVDMDTLPDEPERSHVPLPKDAPFPVSIGFDFRHGVLRLLVPDDVALRLNKWRKAHWHEFVGMGDGYSDAPKRGTWEHRALAYLHSVQCHTTDDMPFIQGESMDGMRGKHGHLPAAAYELLVTTCGIRTDAWPTTGFHFSG